MLLLNLKKIFALRGIPTPYKYLVQNGFNSHTAHRLMNQKTAAIKLQHLEKVCTLLKCTPHDLLEWVPANLLEDTPDHPLQIIRKKDKTIELSKTLAEIPLDKLEEVQKYLEQMRRSSRPSESQ